MEAGPNVKPSHPPEGAELQVSLPGGYGDEDRKGKTEVSITPFGTIRDQALVVARTIEKTSSTGAPRSLSLGQGSRLFYMSLI